MAYGASAGFEKYDPMKATNPNIADVRGTPSRTPTPPPARFNATAATPWLVMLGIGFLLFKLANGGEE